MNSTSDSDTEAIQEIAGWFSPTARYAGGGQLEVGDPHGFLTGPVEFICEQGERETLRMQVDESQGSLTLISSTATSPAQTR